MLCLLFMTALKSDQECWHGSLSTQVSSQTISNPRSPTEGCRWLSREFGDANLEELIPHFDLWLSDVSGFASHGKHLLRLTPEQVSAARGLMSLSFFDKHPEYAWLRRHVNERNTPDLFGCLTLAEHIRVELVGLFDFMLRKAFSMGDAERLVGPERRERVSHQAWCGEGCLKSRRQVNSIVRRLPVVRQANERPNPTSPTVWLSQILLIIFA